MRQILLLSISLFFFSCSTQDKTEISLNELNIRISGDPGRVNPFFAPTTLGRQIFQYIFIPLADYHPQTLELYPILIERIPEAYDASVDGINYVAYDIDFRDDAQWSDGVRVTNKDYLFTVQMIMHPDSKITAWKPYFEALKKISLNDKDNTKLTVYMDPNYMLSKEIALTTYLMPQHIFDKDESMLSIGNEIFIKDYKARDSVEIKVLEAVNNSINDKTEMVQLGPYTIKEFQTDQYIILEALKNYWGSNYPDNPFLQAKPNKIILHMVPDEITAISMAKEGKLDLVGLKSSKSFLELKDDNNFNQNWTFNVPQIMQYYYLGLNNKSIILSDKKLRLALAHLADVDDFIENIDGGLGTRTIGHFNPTKSYYNNDLKPIAFDVEKAKALLDDIGWKDNDGDGVRSKQIEGSDVDLELDLLITGSELSNSIGLLYQESAKKAGVKINLVTKKIQLIRKENLSNFNYDIAALAIVADEAPDDPYSRWHSDNAIPGGSNQTGYMSQQADSLIVQIRNTRDVEIRKQAYLELQKLMYEDQPVIFLYSPLEKIFISKKLTALKTIKRPGYMANTFVAMK